MGQGMDASLVKRSRKDVALGVVYLVAAVLVLVVLTPGTAGEQSTFALESRRGGVEIPAPDLVFPTLVTLIVLGCLIALAGVSLIVFVFI